MAGLQLKQSKRFCIKGHDTCLFGRTKKHHCKKCRAIDNAKYQHSTHRKQYIYKHHLKISYGITVEQYNAMFKLQNGNCAICARPQHDFVRALAVDHDHITGKVRGLLCPICNTNLEVLENKSYCLKASLYLNKAVI